MRLLLVVLLLLSVYDRAFSQLELPEDKVSWKFYAEEKNGEYFLVGKITMIEGWHIYPLVIPEGAYILPSVVEYEKSKDYELLGKMTEPEPHFVHDEKADEDVYYHEGTIYFRQKIKVKATKDFEIKGIFSFQTCDDVKCLAPYETNIAVKVKVVSVEEKMESETIASKLEINKDGIGNDKDGNEYVLVDEVWYTVPKGNSARFYKKYLELGGSHDK